LTVENDIILLASSNNLAARHSCLLLAQVKCSGQLQVGFQVDLPLQQVNVPGGFCRYLTTREYWGLWIMAWLRFSAYIPLASFVPSCYSPFLPIHLIFLPVHLFTSTPVCCPLPHPLHFPHGSSPLLASCFIHVFCPPPPKPFALPRLPPVVKVRLQRLDAALFLFVIIYLCLSLRFTFCKFSILQKWSYKVYLLPLALSLSKGYFTSS